jgi:hypothetical protein
LLKLTVSPPVEVGGVPTFQLDDRDGWAEYPLFLSTKPNWEFTLATTYSNEPLCDHNCGRYITKLKVGDLGGIARHPQYRISCVGCAQCAVYSLKMWPREDRSQVVYLSTTRPPRTRTTTPPPPPIEVDEDFPEEDTEDDDF